MSPPFCNVPWSSMLCWGEVDSQCDIREGKKLVNGRPGGFRSHRRHRICLEQSLSSGQHREGPLALPASRSPSSVLYTKSKEWVEKTCKRRWALKARSNLKRRAEHRTVLPLSCRPSSFTGLQGQRQSCGVGRGFLRSSRRNCGPRGPIFFPPFSTPQLTSCYKMGITLWFPRCRMSPDEPHAWDT